MVWVPAGLPALCLVMHVCAVLWEGGGVPGWLGLGLPPFITLHELQDCWLLFVHLLAST
jgi:hypothetical protein